jgi:hypothetical protein
MATGKYCDVENRLIVIPIHNIHHPEDNSADTRKK